MIREITVTRIYNLLMVIWGWFSLGFPTLHTGDSTMSGPPVIFLLVQKPHEYYSYKL
jgi:hypothetical protein